MMILLINLSFAIIQNYSTHVQEQELIQMLQQGLITECNQYQYQHAININAACNLYQHAGQYQHAVVKGNDLQIHLCAKNY